MADEPNKKMDETLRAYARERRKAPEVPLHPATRKALQSEVARVYPGGNQARSWFDLLRAFWPQLAFGGSLCLILGIAVLSLRQPPPSETDAQPQMSPPATELGLKPEPPPAAGLEIMESLEKKKDEDLLESNLSLADKSPEPANAPARNRAVQQVESRIPPQVRTQPRDSSPPALPPAPGQKKAANEITPDTLVEREGVARSEDLYFRQQPAPAQSPALPALQADTAAAPIALQAVPEAAGKSPISTTAPPDSYGAAFETVARVTELTNLGAARRMNFVQQAPAGQAGATLGAAVLTTPILETFQVEQLGQTLRVLDRDGSVYLGRLAPQTNAPSALAVAGVTAEPVLAKRYFAYPVEPQNAAVFNFTVRGTNQTLGKDVVLTGLYYAKTNPPPSSLDTLSSAPQGPQVPKADLRHVIIGDAIIGATNEVPFRAISREP